MALHITPNVSRHGKWFTLTGDTINPTAIPAIVREFFEGQPDEKYLDADVYAPAYWRNCYFPRFCYFEIASAMHMTDLSGGLIMAHYKSVFVKEDFESYE